MADYYTLFSEALVLDNAEQAQWMRDQLDPGLLDRLRDFENEQHAKSSTSITTPDWAKDAVLARHIFSGDGDASFEFTIEGPDREQKYSITFYSEESGDVDAILALVQAYLKKFAPQQRFGLGWANTCSKSRVGDFGGGAAFVTANKIEQINTFNWLLNKTTKSVARQNAPRK